MVICRYPFSECEKKVFDKERLLYECSGNPCYKPKVYVKVSDYNQLKNTGQMELKF
jgi:hypothetical protein